MIDDTATSSLPTLTTSGRWLMRYPLDVLRGLRERQLAHRVIRECLAHHDSLRREHPSLAGDALYVEVVRRQSGLDEASARQAVHRAEASYADWPVERDLRFQDVVQLLAAERCLAGRPAGEGILTPLHMLIAAHVPEHL